MNRGLNNRRTGANSSSFVVVVFATDLYFFYARQVAQFASDAAVVERGNNCTDFQAARIHP